MPTRMKGRRYRWSIEYFVSWAPICAVLPFIDLGSGKGRVLLIAAQYPFKSVVGVEFSGTLHKIAQTNISKFVEQGLTKTRPISVNMDAGEFDFSQFRDKVVFCNNPFTAELVDNVQLSI